MYKDGAYIIYIFFHHEKEGIPAIVTTGMDLEGTLPNERSHAEKE